MRNRIDLILNLCVWPGCIGASEEGQIETYRWLSLVLFYPVIVNKQSWHKKRCLCIISRESETLVCSFSHIISSAVILLIPYEICQPSSCYASFLLSVSVPCLYLPLSLIHLSLYVSAEMHIDCLSSQFSGCPAVSQTWPAVRAVDRKALHS